MIDIDFKFRVVGQGAFYSGIFRHRMGKQFSFVYDCGTHSSRQYIDQEINRFVVETNHEKIDILFISHFHDDHTNRIASLLNQTGGAKYAILPYLTPDELLLAYIDASLSGGDPDTLEFIQDPAAFLLGRKVEKIIFIHPDDKPDLGGNDEPNKNDITPESPDFEFMISNELKTNSSIDNHNEAVQHYYDSGRLSLVGLWEFKFFNKPRTSTIINTFIQEVKTLLGLNNFNFNDLVNYITRNSKTFESAFNRIYSNNFGARQLINDTSLVIYHGALIRIMNRRIFDRWVISASGGTLLTGDINFNQNCLDQIRIKWINPRYINAVDVFQIPHHGANNYIEPIVVSSFQNVYWWVINFGLGNTHKHPHQDIVNLIEGNKVRGKIFSSTQVNAFDYGCLYR